MIRCGWLCKRLKQLASPAETPLGVGNGGVIMSLTGALEAFPLPEVLRLLARSKKSGTLRIDGADLQGTLLDLVQLIHDDLLVRGGDLKAKPAPLPRVDGEAGYLAGL